MHKINRPLLLAAACVLASCSTSPDPQSAAVSQAFAITAAAERFAHDVVTVAPDLVACTLSGGAKTKCLSITVKGVSPDQRMGPWCPRNIADGPDKAGIWLDGGKVYDADGAFVRNLASFYHDDTWQLFDPKTGAVHVTETKAACLAAARPDVDARYQNYCVECRLADAEPMGEVHYLIPAEPVPFATAQQVDPHGAIGLAFDGVVFDAPVPTHAILGAHTLAPLDDCGGHVNPHVGYHYHAVMGCAKTIDAGDEHAAMLGYAFDGRLLFAAMNSDGSQPANLDACRGHATATMDYHYHVNDPGKNQILSCFTAQQGCAAEAGQSSCEHGDRPPPPPGQPPPGG